MTIRTQFFFFFINSQVELCERLLERWMTVDAPDSARHHSIVQAMYLLSDNIASCKAQHYALRFLKTDCGLLSDWPKVLQNLLPQLVRMLLEQPQLASPLTIFVMEAAVLSPLTTGLELFWLLQIRKETGCVRSAQVISYLMSTLDCGLLRGVYHDQLRLWGEHGVFRRVYNKLSLKPLVLGTENAADSLDSSRPKLGKIRSISSLTRSSGQQDLVSE